METISIRGVNMGGVNHTPEPPDIGEAAPVQEKPEPGRSAPAPPDTLYLPDGTPLSLTLSRKIWLGRLFGREEDDLWAGPARPMEDQTVLYLCGNPHSVWLEPGREDAGPMRPLLQRPRALQGAMDAWIDRVMPDFTLEELRDLSAALWDGEHATQVIALSKKKEMRATKRAESCPTGASNT